MIQSQYHIIPKTITTDNELKISLISFNDSKEIQHQKSCFENPQQNGTVERKHQHILNVGRALLYQSKLQKQYLSYDFIHANFLINMVTSPILQYKAPYYTLYDKKPDLNTFKVFGFLVFSYAIQAYRTKLDARTKKYVFLGYKSGYKCYILLELNLK